ncbi:Uncharacterized protein DBV15_07207 [Temnothorax longispinosus]|uniref:Uncharacterized protein n=1 Tax=Temnothorax longispinosus TaxID=300112 RepID=A0A4S2JAY5_9HYME|nr:Uncharacterized protein DBV15_07207 [Temnothorax longispinosus]
MDRRERAQGPWAAFPLYKSVLKNRLQGKMTAGMNTLKSRHGDSTYHKYRRAYSVINSAGGIDKRTQITIDMSNRGSKQNTSGQSYANRMISQ